METDNNSSKMITDEKKLYRKARKRVRMKIHFTVFLLICIIFWLLYYFLFKDSDLASMVFKFFLAVTLIWGIIVYFHYLIVFKWGNSYVEKEAQRIQKKIEEQGEEKKSEEQTPTEEN